VEVVLEGEAECERGFWIGTACDEIDVGGCHYRRSRLFTVGAYSHVSYFSCFRKYLAFKSKQ